MILSTFFEKINSYIFIFLLIYVVCFLHGYTRTSVN